MLPAQTVTIPNDQGAPLLCSQVGFPPALVPANGVGFFFSVDAYFRMNLNQTGFINGTFRNFRLTRAGWANVFVWGCGLLCVSQRLSRRSRPPVRR